MDRREFIKACSLVAFMGAVSSLTSCKKLLDFSEPALSDFKNEVDLALKFYKQQNIKLELVKVSTPRALNIPDASLFNRFGMAIDLDLCDGCGKCILACNLENNIPLVTKNEVQKGLFMHWIKMAGNMPLMCAHCGNAPCERVCPTGAANHTPDGLSAMVYKRCAGSRFCGANCPIGSRRFNYNDSLKLGLSKKFNDDVPLRQKGVIEKCSLCIHRLQNDKLKFKTLHPDEEWRGRNLKTACAETCPKEAIIFGNWLDKESPLIKRTEGRHLYVPKSLADLDPSIVFVGGNFV